MTAVVIALSILALVPLILVWPHVGILAWTWIGVMNPHRWAWGSLEVLGYAQIIGATTLIAWLVSRAPKRVPMTPVTVMLGLLLVWVTITTVMAHLPGRAWESWEQAFKIILMTFATIALINSRERLHALIWVLVVSLGYYGFKGGVFTVLTGGEYRVWGPEKSFIASNDQLALALIMVLPLIVYLRQHAANTYVRLGLLCLAGMCVFSIIGSQSRGGFLALCVMGLFLVWKSRKRVIMGVAAVFLAVVAVAFVPDSWVERMQTIENYEDDKSAVSRIKAWTFAYKVARDDPITGGGFNVFMDESYFKTLIPDADRATNFHSVYFEVLGEQGFIGLAVFLGLLAAAWFTFSRIMALTRGQPGLAWAHDLARMSQVSLVGYAAGGSFLNLAFYDLIYLLLAIAVIARALVARELDPAPVRGRSRFAAAAAPVDAAPAAAPPAGAPASTAVPSHAGARSAVVRGTAGGSRRLR